MSPTRSRTRTRSPTAELGRLSSHRAQLRLGAKLGAYLSQAEPSRAEPHAREANRAYKISDIRSPDIRKLALEPLGRPLNRRLDLNLLELFDIAFRTRNLTATGAKLGLSQPAVSYGLAKLRETYGDPLFVRMQRGVRPTPLAEQLAEPIANALALVRGTVDRAAFVPAEARHTFRIGMTDIGERYFLPRLARRFGELAPGVVLQSLSPSVSELVEGLASGDIDLAIGFIPGMGKQVHERPLFSEQFVYLMNGEHPARGQAFTAARIRKLRHVVASPDGTRHLDAVEAVLSSPAVGAAIALRVKSFLCIGPIIAETDLVGLVPSNLASLVSGTLKLAVAKPQLRFEPFDISMYWNRRFDQDEASKWLRETVIDLFGTTSKRA